MLRTPSASRCAANAASSVSWASTKAWAVVPPVGIPCRRPASRLEVVSKPPTCDARAAATAASGSVRRDPPSINVRPPAASAIRAAADATAQSWLRTESITVSSTTHSANEPATVSTGL